MVEAGLSTLQVVRAATLGDARAMGRAGEPGTVAAGKRADLVLLDADPARDIRNPRRIALVVRGGKPYRPDSPMAPCVR